MANNFDITAMCLDDVDVRSENFIAANLDEWAQKHIVHPLTELMINAGMADHVISAMKYRRTGPLEFEVEWDLFTEEGAPLSIFLEKGWKEHEIWSKWPNGPMLHWVSEVAGGKAFPQFDVVRGKVTRHHFAKKVTNPGFAGYHLFEQIAQNQTPHLIADMSESLEQHLKDVAIQ